MLESVKDFLYWAESLFNKKLVYFGHGFDNAWDEALALVIFVKGVNWDVDESFLTETLNDAEQQQLFDLVQQRVEKRMPIAYLVGEAWFLGLPFSVNREVLIPRSPIAELIDDGFSLWFKGRSPQNILDLCAGSACIGVCCALTFSGAKVDSSDISASALQLAKKNRTTYELEDRLELIQSDLFQNLAGRSYDLIVANPPYVDQVDMDNLPPEYTHEPSMALAAGDDGLDFVKLILAQANDYLNDEGVIIVEVGNSQEAMIAQFPSVPFLWLEFAQGGHGVFALTAQQLKECRKLFVS